MQAIKNEYKLTNFYPRPPRGGRRLWPSITPPSWPNFYPRPPRGGRHAVALHRAVGDLFLSTPSARRATLVFLHVHANRENFYPRPPRGGRRRCNNRKRTPRYFYPRPPRGGRPGRRCRRVPARPISIHALREEGDGECQVSVQVSSTFLSTPSARRATYFPTPYDCSGQFLSTPSARRATDIDDAVAALTGFLSTPSARRATPSGGGFGGIHTRFLSTPSARRATLYPALSLCPSKFLSTPSARRATPFTPPAGRGHQKFLSTPSARRATHIVGLPSKNRVISIHALREEGDTYCSLTLKKLRYFYPRPPRGGRPESKTSLSGALTISIHALREEGDHKSMCKWG